LRQARPAQPQGGVWAADPRDPLETASDPPEKTRPIPEKIPTTPEKTRPTPEKIPTTPEKIQTTPEKTVRV
jgi:hypothetical protein